MIQDTIAAVSTARGKGGVALLRVSGNDAIRICEDVFSPRSGRPLSEIAPRMAVYGSIYIKEANGKRVAVDDGIATVFYAPASFTGEDTVEITCHGGILLTETVLTALFAAGARPAEAGEFTRRAFLNGKLGLSSAEALGDLLEACSREQILLAHNGMNGRTEQTSRAFFDRLARVLASVYACIDYPDEDLAEMSREEILAELESCLSDLEHFADTYRTGHAVAEGVRTVICGLPNVGKSSLYNRIVGREAAIVTDVEGTTRDLLTETVALGRVTLRLCDTAGLHETADRVEQIGIARAKEELEQAELIMAVFDATRAPTELDLALCRQLAREKGEVVAILNKNDQAAADHGDTYRDTFSHVVSISAKTGEGMETLRETVERLFLDGRLDIENDAVLANARQHAAVLQATERLREAVKALHEGQTLDLCCWSVEAAMSALSELDGREISEELVSRIFSKFCVGK